jgi:hypothetical protein
LSNTLPHPKISGYYSYHELTGRLAYRVLDVYTGTTEGAILPSGITSPTSSNWADWNERAVRWKTAPWAFYRAP